MNDELDPHRQFRATMMAVTLALFFGGGFILFLVVLTQGAILVVPVALLGLGVFGAFHYFLWGRSMTQETADEREEEQRREQEEVDEWDMPRFRQTRRF